MKLKKNGRLHTMAYFGFDKKPDKTNICSLFWRSVSFLFVLCPLILSMVIFFVVSSTLVYAVGTPIAFILFGYRPRLITPNTFPEFFKPISRWPKWRGHHFMLGVILFYVLFAYLLLYLLFVLYTEIVVGVIFASTLYASLFVFGVVTVLCLLARLVYKDTEEWQVVREYAKAKKAKFCPVVEFVEMNE